jgi:hypothetical protein
MRHLCASHAGKPRRLAGCLSVIRFSARLAQRCWPKAAHAEEAKALAFNSFGRAFFEVFQVFVVRFYCQCLNRMFLAGLLDNGRRTASSWAAPQRFIEP